MRKLILLSSLFFSTTICFAQSGELDPTFGNQGIVKTDMGAPFNYSNVTKQILMQLDGSMYLIVEAAGLTLITKKNPDGLTDVSYGNNGYSSSVAIYESVAAQQNDGKIVVIGTSLNSSDYFNNRSDFAIARFNTDGTLDDTFGTHGKQITDIGANDRANAIAFQSNGKIVVAGISNNLYATSSFALARYNTDGSLDVTQLTYVFSPYADDYATSVAIQSDGKIVVGGSFILRYDSNAFLDSSFNGEGHQLISGVISEIAMQSDGKILVVVGNSIFRYYTDGILDSTFGVNGIQATDFAEVSLAVQGNGKIILAGSRSSGIDSAHFVVARYNTDWITDSSFSDDGMQIADVGDNDYGNSIIFQSDGKFVVFGYTVSGADTTLSAARYDTLGSLDNSFDGDGILMTSLDHIKQGFTLFTSTAIQNDGKIVSAGYTWNGSNYDFAVARYNTDGSLDNTFSGDGKQMTDFNSTNDTATAIIIQSDGKILVAGSAGDRSSLARYNADGSPDISFTGDGMQITDFDSPNNAASLALQTDGKIIVGGSSLARYNIDGSLDISFDGDGKVTLPFYCNAVAVQSDDKIVILGGNVSVARYNINGSDDSTFNNGIPVSFDLGGGGLQLIGTSIAIQNDGRIVIGGYHVWSYFRATVKFALVRFKTDGSVDSTLNGYGYVVANTYNGPISETSGTGNAYASSVIIQNDNKIILGGYSHNGVDDDFTIARFNNDGTFDSTFGSDGIVVTPVSGAFDRISGMAVSNDKLYAVGYGQYPGNFGVIARYSLAEGGPLPVSLLEFTGVLQNKSVLLKWKIATEKNLTRFVIERSADGNKFLPINSVTAAGINTLNRNYSITDGQPMQGINFYRLKLVDADGKFTYSNIVAIRINSENKLQIFPNPANRILFVEANGNDEKAIVDIVDGAGRKLKEMQVTLNGRTSFSVDISSLPQGFYNLILHKNDKTDVQSFIKK